MAADVTTLVQILNGYLDEQQHLHHRNHSHQPDLITKDLIGISTSKDLLDLDSQVPSGWEKRLDLKSGKVYLQRNDSPILSTTSSTITTTTTTSNDQKQASKKFQDLNFPPTYGDESLLDLKLVPSYDYRSVCTLDKVKSALERAGKEESAKKRSLSQSKSSSMNEEDDEEDVKSLSSSSSPSGLMFAGGCPSCLMYVMIAKNNPKCPRCDSFVPSPMFNKKPKLDLNLNLNLNLLSS